MTRKDYELIARILKAYAHSDSMTATYNAKHDRPPSETDIARTIRLESIVDSFANVLGSDNPRFNRETFLKACQP